jgi:steroid 5-alpha reductase family enzyme
MKKIARFPSLLICLTGYLFSFFAVIALYRITRKPVNLLAATFVYDLAATFLIFIFSFSFNNSSFYDPYWSVAPLIIIPAWFIHSGMNGVNSHRQWLIISLVFIWSFRLTFNWMRRWKGMGDEDWRYARYRRFSRPVYWLTSLVGFHVFPTLVVFAGCLSVYPALCRMPQSLNKTDALAFFISFTGIAMETVADKQLKDFLRHKGDKLFLSSGLWKYTRHPNYFGEILFWTGLFAFSLPAHPFAWYTIAGPVAMILMFSLVSVPMMDKRMSERKPGYADYAKTTNALVPWESK